MNSARIEIKRIYDPVRRTDGVRILVERLWPRGVTKTRAALDEWARDLAPSPELRQWFNHDPDRWPEFRARYREELQSKRLELERLVRLAKDQRITLIYAARDEAHNSAIVLKQVLDGHTRSDRRVVARSTRKERAAPTRRRPAHVSAAH